MRISHHRPRLVFMVALALLPALCAWVLVRTTAAEPLAPCTHYAAPTGTGTACTQAQPCLVQSFWPHAAPGTTLCLMDGTYTGAASMVTPPAGVAGTETQPVTVRAWHDGQVLLDAGHEGFAVLLHYQNGNDWMVVEGVNAMNGLEAVYSVSSANSLLRRVIGWNGTSGWNPYVITITGYNSRAEDCAGWGDNIRKVLNGSQAGNVLTAGFRRCFGEWNDHPKGGSGPSATMQLGYNTTNQLFENMIGTWHTTGDTQEGEGVLTMMENQYDEAPNAIEGSQVLGSLFYVRPGSTYSAGALVQAGGLSGLLMRDVAMVVAPGYRVLPALLMGCTGAVPCTQNRCENCLAVHAGLPLVNQAASGFTLPGLRQGLGLQAATGGVSAFELLPGLCKRYVGGQLTDTPLWPWPMNERIKEARLASGALPVDVTAQVEALLGPIPAACTGSAPPPAPGTPQYQAVLRWADLRNTAQTGYRIHRQIVQANGSLSGYIRFPGTLPPTARRFVDGRPVAGTTNCYAVSTLSATGSSPLSSPDACAPVPGAGNPGETPPLPVTDVGVTIRQNRPER